MSEMHLAGELAVFSSKMMAAHKEGEFETARKEINRVHCKDP